MFVDNFLSGYCIPTQFLIMISFVVNQGSSYLQSAQVYDSVTGKVGSSIFDHGLLKYPDVQYFFNGNIRDFLKTKIEISFD